MGYTAIGHTVGLAQRMESLAPAGCTALSAATASLIPGEFDLRELGEFEVRARAFPSRYSSLWGRLDCAIAWRPRARRWPLYVCRTRAGANGS